MLEIKNIKELNSNEIKKISGGSLESYSLGFIAAGFVDFEIGMAIGLGNAVVKFWDNL